jgi:hypothetical protein
MYLGSVVVIFEHYEVACVYAQFGCGVVIFEQYRPHALIRTLGLWWSFLA